MAAAHDICRFHGVPKVPNRRRYENNDAGQIEDFIGSEGDFPTKNNFHDVIRLEKNRKKVFCFLFFFWRGVGA